MQGFNMGRYVPPELEGRVSFNQASGKGHALGSRARKLKSEGVLAVRFECPFAIWCTNCKPEQIIGQGVRFNAEKKKVGNYYSTPIWSFRFKHTLCGEWLEVRTDPKNAEYVVTEGGRRRDTGTEKLLDGEVRIDGATEEEKERLEKEGGFGALEKKVEDKRAFVTQQQRIEQLAKASERDWADPYAKSQMLRREFRVGRRKRQLDAKTGEALQEKFGIGVEMLEETEEDADEATGVSFGESTAVDASTKPLFAAANGHASSPLTDRGKRGKKPNAADSLVHKKSALQTRLQANTRGVSNAFSGERGLWRPRIKRKRNEVEEVEKVELPGSGLVGYDSDSA